MQNTCMCVHLVLSFVYARLRLPCGRRQGRRTQTCQIVSVCRVHHSDIFMANQCVVGEHRAFFLEEHCMLEVASCPWYAQCSKDAERATTLSWWACFDTSMLEDHHSGTVLERHVEYKAEFPVGCHGLPTRARRLARQLFGGDWARS